MFWKVHTTSFNERNCAGSWRGKENAKPSVKPIPTSTASSNCIANSYTSKYTNKYNSNGITRPASTAGLQVISQAQSIVAVNANEKAWLEQAGLIKLDPGKLFSYQAWLTEVSKGKVPEKKAEEFRMWQSLLYEAALRAGMQVGERYAHQDNPAYAPAGFDVDFQVSRKI